MASRKTGLDSFPFMVNLFSNKKIKLLANDCGDGGVIIWLKILAYAYEHYGYYFDMNDAEEVDLFAVDICKCKPQMLQSVVGVCIKRRLFIKPVFDVYKVLTCEDMQDTYLHATTERRRKGTIVSLQEEFLQNSIFTKQYKYTENINIIRGKDDLIPWKKEDDTGKIPHSIVKDSIVKDSIVKESKGKPANTIFFQKKEGEEKQQNKPGSFSEVLQFYDATLNKIGIDGAFISSQAQKFFNHYESNGWKVDDVPIENWQARARYWINEDLKKIK